MAAKAFPSIEAAQEKLCPKYRIFTPDSSSVAVYEKLYSLYKRLYFGFGKRDASAIEAGDVLPELRLLAHQARQVQ